MADFRGDENVSRHFTMIISASGQYYTMLPHCHKDASSVDLQLMPDGSADIG